MSNRCSGRSARPFLTADSSGVLHIHHQAMLHASATVLQRFLFKHQGISHINLTSCILFLLCRLSVVDDRWIDVCAAPCEMHGANTPQHHVPCFCMIIQCVFMGESESARTTVCLVYFRTCAAGECRRGSGAAHRRPMGPGLRHARTDEPRRQEAASQP